MGLEALKLPKPSGRFECWSEGTRKKKWKRKKTYWLGQKKGRRKALEKKKDPTPKWRLTNERTSKVVGCRDCIRKSGLCPSADIVWSFCNRSYGIICLENLNIKNQTYCLCGGSSKSLFDCADFFYNQWNQLPLSLPAIFNEQGLWGGTARTKLRPAHESSLSYVVSLKARMWHVSTVPTKLGTPCWLCHTRKRRASESLKAPRKINPLKCPLFYPGRRTKGSRCSFQIFYQMIFSKKKSNLD